MKIKKIPFEDDIALTVTVKDDCLKLYVSRVSDKNGTEADISLSASDSRMFALAILEITEKNLKKLHAC